MPHAALTVTVPPEAVPAGGYVAVGPDRQVLLVDSRDGVAGYVNRCLHVGNRLDGGQLRDGVLTCPHHLWRYRVTDGRCVAGGAAARGRGLTRVPVRRRDDHLEVELPPPPPSGGVRAQLLEHARTWRRDR